MTITLFILIVVLGIFSIKLVKSYKCEEVLNNRLSNAIIYSLSETTNKFFEKLICYIILFILTVLIKNNIIDILFYCYSAFLIIYYPYNIKKFYDLKKEISDTVNSELKNKK